MIGTRASPPTASPLPLVLRYHRSQHTLARLLEVVFVAEQPNSWPLLLAGLLLAGLAVLVALAAWAYRSGRFRAIA